MRTAQHLLATSIVAIGSFAALGSAQAQATKSAQRPLASTRVSGDAKLKAEAKIKETDAVAIARKEVPSGKIESGEIEREGGKLIYSFDIKVPGKSGIEEVNVDAMTGRLIAHEHETPKAEKREAAKEAREKKAQKP